MAQNMAPRLCTHVSYFPTPREHDEFLRICANKKVAIERLFSLEFLVKINWEYLELFRALGWLDFVLYSGVSCDNLVRVFYFNGDCRVREDGVPIDGTSVDNAFMTNVCGNPILVDADVIGHFMPSPNCNEGNEDFMDPLDAAKIVYKMDDLNAFVSEVTWLTIHDRILHYMVSYVFMGRGGSHASITHQEMVFMAKVMIGNPPNLCREIATRMVDAVNWSQHKNTYHLPYGKLITRMCGAFCHNLGEETYVLDGGVGILNEQAMLNAGWKLHEDRQEWIWHPRKNTTRRRNLVIEEPQVAQEPVQEENVGAMSLNTMMEEIRRMHATTLGRLDLQDRRQEYFYGDLRAIRHHLGLGDSDTPFPYPPP